MFLSIPFQSLGYEDWWPYFLIFFNLFTPVFRALIGLMVFGLFALLIIRLASR